MLVSRQKAIRKNITQQLEDNLGELKALLGDKKFKRRIKKAGKLLTEGIDKTPKTDKAPAKAIDKLPAPAKAAATKTAGKAAAADKTASKAPLKKTAVKKAEATKTAPVKAAPAKKQAARKQAK